MLRDTVSNGLNNVPTADIVSHPVCEGLPFAKDGLPPEAAALPQSPFILQTCASAHCVLSTVSGTGRYGGAQELFLFPWGSENRQIYTLEDELIPYNSCEEKVA